jgi:hypothetical protein
VASLRDFKMSLQLIIVRYMSLITSWETLQGDNHCIYFFMKQAEGLNPLLIIHIEKTSTRKSLTKKIKK